MTTRRSYSQEPDTRLNDGAATLRLREMEKETALSRRSLWRAGLATAAGVGVLSALDQQRADAATGGNFVLGQANSANAVTSLSGSPTAAPLMNLDGSSVSATQSTLVVQGSTGGGAVQAKGASTSTTIGFAVMGSGAGTALGVIGSSAGNAGVRGSSGTSTGVEGSSTSGNGVYGHSNTGAGVYAASTGGTALAVNGKATFSRSGKSIVRTGRHVRTIKVAGVTGKSMVFVTLQSNIRGVWVKAATPGAGKITVHLNRNTPAGARFSWFVLN